MHFNPFIRGFFMKKEFKALLLILLAQVVGVIYTVFSYDHYCLFFPFSSQELTPQSYVFYACQDIQIIIYVHAVSFFVKKYALEMKVFLFLQYIYLIDYLLSYNQANVYLLGMYFDCDILRIVVMSFFLIKIICKWILWETR